MLSDKFISSRDIKPKRRGDISVESYNDEIIDSLETWQDFEVAKTETTTMDSVAYDLKFSSTTDYRVDDTHESSSALMADEITALLPGGLWLGDISHISILSY